MNSGIVHALSCRGPRLPLTALPHRPTHTVSCRPRPPSLLGPNLEGDLRVLLRVFGILPSPATMQESPLLPSTIQLPETGVSRGAIHGSAPCTLTASHADASPEHRVGRNLPRDKHGAVTADEDA